MTCFDTSKPHYLFTNASRFPPRTTKDPKPVSRLFGLSIERTMKLLQQTLAFVILLTKSVCAFTTDPRLTTTSSKKTTTHLTADMSSSNSQVDPTNRHPFCDLPGDPSLMLTTNVDLGSKKLDIMKGKTPCSMIRYLIPLGFAW